MQKYWKIFWQFRKIDVMKLLAYRLDFVFWSGISVMWTIFNFFLLWILVGITGQIGGWNTQQILLLIATYTIIDSFTWSIFYPNMYQYTQEIFDGALSGWLLKPVSARFIIMTRFSNIHNIFRLIMGIVVALWAGWQLGGLNLANLLFYSFLVVVSSATVYVLWFVIATAGFWVERLNNINDILPSLRRVYQAPHTIYQGFFAILFNTVIPLGLLSSVPSEVLFTTPSWILIGQLLLFLGVLMVISNWFWQVSIRRYGSVGG